MPLKWEWPREIGKGLERKRAETHSSVLKVQPQGLAHSILTSSKMGCSAARAFEEGEGFEICGKETPPALPASSRALFSAGR